MSTDKVLTVGCLCGAICYEAREPHIWSIVCHCRMCQRTSGSAFAALFYVPAANIAITKGTPHTYRPSPAVDRLFCHACGSPLFFQRTGRLDLSAIFVGSLDDPNDFEPGMHVCLSSAVAWLDMRDGADRYGEKPEGMSPTLHYDVVTGQARYAH